MPNTTTICDILNTIADKYSLGLFEAIATNGGGDDLRETLQMTTKQFYNRTAKLMRLDLIMGRDGKYSLTSLGRILYSILIMLAKAMDNRWKFKAIDSIIDNKQLSPTEYARTIDALFDDIELKRIIVNVSIKNPEYL